MEVSDEPLTNEDWKICPECEATYLGFYCSECGYGLKYRKLDIDDDYFDIDEDD